MTVPPQALVGHGPPATAALADLLGTLKSGDPLRPVTVAVPHPWAGLSLRRSLAARPGGVVNVQFLVLARVAELIGAPSLAAAGRRPRTPTVTRAAVRAVLRHQPGEALAPVADHPATEAAVVRLVDELSSVGAPGRARLAARGGRAADLAALVDRVIAAAPRRYDRHDLVRAAAAAVRAGGSSIDEVGHLVVHLPAGLTPAELDLVAALAERGAVHVLLGATGDDRADAPTRRLQGRLTALLGEAAVLDPVDAPVAQRIVTTTDPDDEVRAALRTAIEAWEAGTPLDRIAMVHSSPDPYARLVTEQAQAAAIPIAGPATSTLAASVAGRTLLGALALPDSALARDAVCDWMASAPLRQADGRRVPTARWDELTRQAGLVAGDIDAWNHHLDALLERMSERAARLARPDDEPDERLERDRRQVEALRTFVTWLDAQLTALSRLGSWSAMAAWASTFLRDVLGSDSQRSEWPDDQFAASDAVTDALERLGALDEVESAPTAATFRRALAAELDTSHGHVGSVGRGILFLPLQHAVGLDLDLVIVLGMAEGTLPGRTRDDALLPDADRDLVGDGLARRSDAVVDQHHQLLAAMAAAPHRVLMSPRGDLRQSRARVPSRWLLDSVSALAGRTITTRDFDDADLPGVQRIASFAAGVTDSPHHVSVDERDLAALHRWVAGGRRADDHPLVVGRAGLAAGLEVLDARRHQGFNRFTGAVRGVELPTFRSGDALSPTALERWATCPRRYFFAQVLRVRARETPEFVDRISAASKGTLVHEVLDRFYTEVIARPDTKPSDEPWSDADRGRVREIFEAVSREFEDEGLVGRRVLWALDREDIAQDLMRFLDADDAYRRAEGAVPVATELAFGPDAPTGATLDLPGGRHVSFKGFADRVDRRADGSLVVLDYKTGRLYPEVRQIADDPTFVAGTKLQLPVYALAAATAHGTPDTPVRAAYWHISSREAFAQAGYQASPDRQAQFVEVLTHIADGIEGGIFPAYPGDPDTWRGGFSNCGYCDFDSVCGRNRLHEWEGVRTAPEVVSYLELRGAAVDEDGEADS